jgi:hypothetical protein
MSVTENNRRIMTAVMNALAEGDSRPFVNAMDERFAWIMRGSTWAGEWRGKESVRRDLLRPLLDQFETVYTNTPRRIFADGDFVIVECKGNVMTKTGKRYDNDYCFVIEMRNGKMIELTEYLDTALVNEALEPLS